MKNILLAIVCGLFLCRTFCMEDNRLSVIDLPEEVRGDVFMKLSPFAWPHIMRTCKEFHKSFAPGGIICLGIQYQHGKSVAAFLEDQLERLNIAYQYSLFTNAVDNVKTLHMHEGIQYVNGIKNWLSPFNNLPVYPSLTPLFWACLGGHAQAVEKIVKELKKDVLNSPAVRKQITPAFVSCIHGQQQPSNALMLFEIFNKYSFDFNANIPSAGLPLMLAIAQKQFECVQYLLKNCSINPNILLPVCDNRTTIYFFTKKENKEQEYTGYISNTRGEVQYLSPLAHAITGITAKTCQDDLKMVQLLINCNAKPDFTGKMFGGTSAYDMLYQIDIKPSLRIQFKEVLDMAEFVNAPKSGDSCTIQ